MAEPSDPVQLELPFEETPQPILPEAVALIEALMASSAVLERLITKATLH